MCCWLFVCGAFRCLIFVCKKRLLFMTIVCCWLRFHCCVMHGGYGFTFGVCCLFVARCV